MTNASLPPNKPSFFSKIPSIAWVIIIPATIAAGLAIIIGAFVGLATIEGFASMILLVAGFFCFRGLSDPQYGQVGSFSLAMSIVFFALMGMSIDQPGNFVYNKPLEMAFCPPQTVLLRGVDTYHLLPGRTDIIQNFACYDLSGENKKELGTGEIVLTRFVEYILIGYILFFLNKFTHKKNS